MQERQQLPSSVEHSSSGGVRLHIYSRTANVVCHKVLLVHARSSLSQECAEFIAFCTQIERLKSADLAGPTAVSTEHQSRHHIRTALLLVVAVLLDPSISHPVTSKPSLTPTEMPVGDAKACA